MAGRPDLERITCVEIIRPQLETLSRLLERWPYPGLVSILSDRRIEHVYGDGRLHVMHATHAYDIIEADALRPTSAYAGILYSDAYFDLIRDRLKPGGLAVTWSPTVRVHNTFVSVFPHVLSYGDILLGSNQPIEFDVAAIRGGWRTPRSSAYYRRPLVDIVALLDAVSRPRAASVRPGGRSFAAPRHQHGSLSEGRVLGAAHALATKSPKHTKRSLEIARFKEAHLSEFNHGDTETRSWQRVARGRARVGRPALPAGRATRCAFAACAPDLCGSASLW